MKREEKKLSETFKDASYGEHTSDDWSKFGFTHQDALKWKMLIVQIRNITAEE
mgnify:FL=1